MTRAGVKELLNSLQEGEEDFLAHAAGRKKIKASYFPEDEAGSSEEDFTSRDSKA